MTIYSSDGIYISDGFGSLSVAEVGFGLLIVTLIWAILYLREVSR